MERPATICPLTIADRYTAPYDLSTIRHLLTAYDNLWPIDIDPLGTDCNLPAATDPCWTDSDLRSTTAYRHLAGMQ